MLDRYITGGEIDQPARNEEWRHLARAALLQKDRRVGDAGKAADTGADHGAGGAFLFFGRWMPAGVIECLRGCRHRKDDEVVDLALVLWLHPLVGIEARIGTVAARHHASDLARQIGDVERLDPPRAARPLEDLLPGR